MCGRNQRPTFNQSNLPFVIFLSVSMAYARKNKIPKIIVYEFIKAVNGITKN